MKNKTSIFLLFAGFLGFASAQQTWPSESPRSQNMYQEDAFYIRFRENSLSKSQTNGTALKIGNVPFLKSMQEIYGIHPQMKSMSVKGNPSLGRTFYLRFDSTGKTQEFLEKLENNEHIEYVEKVPIYYIQGTFSSPQKENGNKQEVSSDSPEEDPFYGTVEGNNFSWHLDLIHAQDAWEMQNGNSDIVIAVVDNAIWGNHPDLQIDSSRQYNVLSGTVGSSAPPASVDQDPGCSNLINCYAYNWSHGTHCAGAIGAINKNGIGIASIGSGVSLMGVSCPGTDVSGLQVRNGFSGIVWAAEHGAKVINLSWGSYSISQTEREIVQSCIDNGIIIVAAAGNDGYKDRPFYPAYLPGVISVASVNSDNRISSFSNYGKWVCIASPGGFVSTNGNETSNCILSTTYCTSQNYRMNGISALNGQYYDGMYGTSMASPIVSGLCGLLLSADSTLSSYLIREILVSSSQAITDAETKSIQDGAGIIDASAALKMVKDRCPMPENLTLTRTGRNILLQWEKPASAEPLSYRIFRDNILLGQTETLDFTDSISGEGLYRYGVQAIYSNDTSLKTDKDIYVPQLFDVLLSYRPENCGSVNGGGIYTKNETITLVATPVKGCKFSRWTEGSTVLSRDSLTDYTVTYSTEITAVFTGTPEVGNELSVPIQKGFKIYPNPTSGQLTVKTEGGEIFLVEIFSIDGILKKSLSCSNSCSQITLDVNMLSSGNYILKAFTSEGIQTGKFHKI